MAASDRETCYCYLRLTGGDRNHPFKNKVMIRALSVIVPGNCFAGSKCKYSCLHIAAFYHWLNALDLVTWCLNPIRTLS